MNENLSEKSEILKTRNSKTLKSQNQKPSSRKLLQAFGRAQAPTPALKARPAFASELFTSFGDKSQSKTGQLQSKASKTQSKINEMI